MPTAVRGGAVGVDGVYITWSNLPAEQTRFIVRSHWRVENSLHWVTDMVFTDDECRVRTENAPASFTTLKHMAHILFRKAKSWDTLRLRRRVAACHDEFLASLVTA
ncbi:MAG: transposase [Rhodospirillales bacterium]|nr:transposase [Rhodospirillales bacterium]